MDEAAFVNNHSVHVFKVILFDFTGDICQQTVSGWLPHFEWNFFEKAFTSCFEENHTAMILYLHVAKILVYVLVLSILVNL